MKFSEFLNSLSNAHSRSTVHCEMFSVLVSVPTLINTQKDVSEQKTVPLHAYMAKITFTAIVDSKFISCEKIINAKYLDPVLMISKLESLGYCVTENTARNPALILSRRKEAWTQKAFDQLNKIDFDADYARI